MKSSNTDAVHNTLLIILTTLGATINGVLFICLVRNPLGCFRNSAGYLVANQALAGLSTCLVMAGYCTTRLWYPFKGDSVAAGVLLVLTFTRFLALFLVSLDRCLAVRFPFTYRIHVKSSVTFNLIFAIWLTTVVLILYSIFAPDSFNASQCILWGISTVLVLAKICLHCLAFWTMRQTDAKIRSNMHPLGQDAQLSAVRQKRRFLLTVFMITLVVLVTIMPFLSYVRLHGVPWSGSNSLDSVIFAIYWLGPLIGPCIYFLRLRNYSRTLKVLLCKICSS